MMEAGGGGLQSDEQQCSGVDFQSATMLPRMRLARRPWSPQSEGVLDSTSHETAHETSPLPTFSLASLPTVQATSELQSRESPLPSVPHHPVGEGLPRKSNDAACSRPWLWIARGQLCGDQISSKGD